MLEKILETGGNVPFPYAIYTPEGYEKGGSKKWPLVIFLHGAGEVGTDLNAVFRHGIAKRINEGARFPFVCVMPQIYPGGIWNCHIESLNRFLDHLLETLDIDADKVSVTGLSMGGTAAWCWISEYASRFSCAVPVCGAGIQWAAGRMVNLPIWIYHGDKDCTVLPVESDMMYDALTRRNAVEVRYTVCEGWAHDSWTPAYNDPRLYEWMMSKSRGIPNPQTPPCKEVIK